jgi:hypothetical protein
VTNYKRFDLQIRVKKNLQHIMSGLVEYELSDNESDNENNEFNLLSVDYKTDEEGESEERKENSSEEKLLKRKKFDDLDDEHVVIRLI